MGKAVGAIAGGFAKDSSLRSGTRKGLQGYDAQIRATKAGKDEALGFLDPYTNVGQGALSQLSTLVTGQSYDPETGEMTQVNPEDRFTSFQASPGYQFRMDEGLRALQSSQAAKGNIYSGGALKELTRYGQGLASSEYGNYLGNLQQLTGVGQASAGQSANVATDAAGQIGQARLGQGNLMMQRNFARGQNQAEMFSAAGSGFDSFAGTGAIGSDRNIKENIKEVGKSRNGLTIYHFDYKDKKYGEGRFEGVMAQDLLESNPEAVIKKDNILMVDYSKIDVNFKRI